MLTVMDWFCGAGGSSQGAHAVPGVSVARAANHWEVAIKSHATNFPTTNHWRGDIRTAPVHRWPVCDVFWASPECPKWSRARGRRRDFHNTRQGALFDAPGTARAQEDERSRALMEEVPLYLEGAAARGGRVLAGVVENVIDCRAWDAWDVWIGRLHALGYRTRTIALNSMHARPVRTPAAPQSRDRLYVAYWHVSLGRTPDWDKWLRPKAWCPVCERRIDAVQTFKNPRRDMGRYRQQYLYRCPRASCRGAVVEPEVLPAAAAIDWSLSGTRIGERAEPLAEATMERIRQGIARYWRPVPAPAGGTWHTRTTRNETGLALPGAFIAELRGGGSVARPVADALATVTASGNHHGLVTPPAEAGALLVPYYGTGVARPTGRPVGALTTRDRYGLAHPGDTEAIALDDVRFRMLEPHEIGRAMAFTDGYQVLGNKRQRVRQYGNAVTPPVAEVLISALTEAITGENLEVAT